MNAFEFNKIAGAVLSAALLIFGGKTLLEIADSGHGHQKAGYTLPMPKGGATPGGAAEAPAKFDPAAVLAALPKASAEAGKDNFKQCTACHTIDKGGANRVGPNLYGIVGRDVGKHAGFSYSPALVAKGGKWTWQLLADYLHDPKTSIPGNKMSFKGITDTPELADMLAYLRTAADSPAELPK